MDEQLTTAELAALARAGWALDGGIESDGVMLLRFRREGVRVQTVAEWRGELTRLEEAVDDAVLANYRAIQASMAQATAQLAALRQENARLRTDRNGAHEIARAARAAEAAERAKRVSCERALKAITRLPLGGCDEVDELRETRWTNACDRCNEAHDIARAALEGRAG